jgi:tetratricopeptide (TPR) repeat protein
MRCAMRPSLVLAMAVLLAPAPASALQARRDPPRPRLETGADTNDAVAYYNRGVDLLEHDAQAAANAFFWATRLDPTWAEAYYARRIAGLMADSRLLLRYLDGDRRTAQSAEVQRLDSLEYRAQRINPFFARDLDKAFFFRYVIASVDEGGNRPLEGGERMELEFLVEQAVRSNEVSPWLRAHLAQSQRKYPEALSLFRYALSQSRNTVTIHEDLGTLFFATGAFDSALTHMRAALEELGQRDADRLVRVYESKEGLEYAIGVIHERRGDLAAAREAYGRSLQEDLSYYPAHLRLGLLAFARGDTAQALQELGLAVEVAPAEAPLRVTDGALLAQVGRTEEAVPHLRKAIELEPYYPLPYYLLGRVDELSQRRAEALADYRAFLARASLRHPRRDEVTRRIADLEALPPSR